MWNSTMNQEEVVDSNESLTTQSAAEGSMENSTNGIQPVVGVTNNLDEITFFGIKATLGIAGTLANLFVLVVLVAYSNVKSKTANMLIVNQSVADLMVSIVICIPLKLDAVLRHDSVIDQLYCRLEMSGFLLYTPLIASTYNIVALTVERYIAVIHPVVHKVNLTPKKTYVIIAVVWIFAIIYNGVITIPSTDIVNDYCMIMGISTSAVVEGIMEYLVTLPVEYLAPSLTMAFCYARMYRVLKRKVAPQHHQQLQQPATMPAEKQRGPDTAGVNQYEGAMRNILKTVVTVVVVYYVIWTPYEVQWILQYCGVITIDFSGWLFRSSVFLTFVGCLINPLIYALKYKDFKQALERMLSSGSHQTVKSTITHRTNVHSVV